MLLFWNFLMLSEIVLLVFLSWIVPITHFLEHSHLSEWGTKIRYMLFGNKIAWYNSDSYFQKSLFLFVRSRETCEEFSSMLQGDFFS